MVASRCRSSSNDVGLLEGQFKEQKKANALCPTLLPADLRELDSYKRFLERAAPEPMPG